MEGRDGKIASSRVVFRNQGRSGQKARVNHTEYNHNWNGEQPIEEDAIGSYAETDAAMQFAFVSST